MKTTELKSLAEKYRVRQWEIADKMGINHCTLSVHLRADELKPDEEKKYLEAIKSLCPYADF